MGKIYVSMTDKVLSGWGQAKGLVAKYVYECDSWEEAEIVEQNASARSDQKYVNICLKKPYYNKNRYLVMVKNKENNPNWYKKGYFRRNNG
jgi:hypothetical protein